MMKNYVVGILSLFENDLKLFKIEADNKYDAAKKGLLEFCDDSVSRKYEQDWQDSPDYPSDYDELANAYAEIPFNVIEI